MIQPLLEFYKDIFRLSPGYASSKQESYILYSHDIITPISTSAKFTILQEVWKVTTYSKRNAIEQL